ncbi:hypothetical protein KC906_00595, partial [Candidatus Kaiserbacteria bacterium]|nr:hypothetical protein [Candidatus Kaiserbacteria bacterium]
TLTPTDARTEDRAMTVGPRLDFSTDTAWLGQLFFPSGYSWDGAGEWYYTSAQVQMLLTSTYLVKVAGNSNVAMTPPSFSGPTASSGSMSTNITMPDGAEIMLIGSPVNDVATPYDHPGGLPAGSNGTFVVHWPWTGVLTAALQGHVDANYTRTSYSGSVSSSETQSGRQLDYLSSNGKIWDVRNEVTRQTDYNHVVATHGPESTSGGSKMGADSSTLWWGEHIPSGWDLSTLEATRGSTYKDIDDVLIPGTSVTGRSYQEQTGSFSVKIGANPLVEGSYTRNKSSGQGTTIWARTGTYDAYFLPGPGYAAGWVTIYYYAGVGLGGGTRATVTFYASPSTDIIPIYDYYKNPSGSLQDPSATAEINDKYGEAVTAFMGQTMYGNEDDSGHVSKRYYDGAIVPSLSLDNSTMCWSTKDYILYDETNGVYISVESSFVGVDTSATLDVILKVQTRHHTTTQILGQYNYT